MSQKRISDQDFRRIWNAEDNRVYLANMLGVQVKAVTFRAKRLRDRGYQMRVYQEASQASVPDTGIVPADKPTQYAPGTAEKIMVMARRVRAGQFPCHPDDATPKTAVNRMPHQQWKQPKWSQRGQPAVDFEEILYQQLETQV